ncbi:N-acetylglutaminylglutamine amidotransferase [Nitrospina watsonii]|uniref:asparagine synthase (glutamine-hydrolyzing) n=1 Tax=Nitrospina watsonii TaxID=1323948 RepID=A0ABM9HGE2_9BACT|nr:N-acetylglutaminylglutamine amidotransferase [Nitrospina watsonii]CAI2719352.1 Asparagine synthetase (glutamine-hydrolyzing) [Nitrospina watsonii]
MCGICGEYRSDGTIPDSRAVTAMAEALAPRGPDGNGLFSQRNVAFAHRRLKIIDLSEASHQPMTDSALGLVVVYNGILYNYKELRKELQDKGYSFFSHGDTEVLLKAYHAWGKDCVQRFQGMFAFALWERDTGKMILARDRLGIKPLYFSSSGGRFRFASSLPALVAGGQVDTSIDPVALHFYMSFHAVVPPPYTIFQGVRKLPPGHMMEITPDGGQTMKPYWSLSYARTKEDETCDAVEWKERVMESLKTAVRRRLVADVPVGVLLSGGLDSSLIVALLADLGQSGLNTFSVGFEAAGGELGDEFEYSDLIAREFSTEHHKIFVQSKEVLPNLMHCVQAMSEPMVSHDNIGFFLLSREVAKSLKVVQSGQGADEVFGGYFWYPPLMDSQDPIADYSKLFFDRTHDEYATAVHHKFVTENHSQEFLKKRFAETDAVGGTDKALWMDTTVMLVDDPVKRVDNMTMAWGLEARVPFLDHELVELAARIPPALKVKDGGKGILKDVGREVLPHQVIDRPKGYFPVPALKYIQGEYLGFVRDVFEQPSAKQRSLFKKPYLDRMFENPEQHITPLQGSKLWQMALLEMWLQVHQK